jgi:hypothetical protein
MRGCGRCPNPTVGDIDRFATAAHATNMKSKSLTNAGVCKLPEIALGT